MCSLFGLIDFKECLSTHTKNKILNTLARECQVRGTDATGIAYNFNDRLRIYKRPLPARKRMRPASPIILTTAFGSTSVHFPLGK